MNVLRAAVCLAVAASCSSNANSAGPKVEPTIGPRTPASLPSTFGLAAGSGRVAGHLGPGRPGENGAVPAVVLTFSNGHGAVNTTVHDGAYSVDLAADTWDVHSDDHNVCATGLRVTAGASQSADLIWPFGSCQDLSGQPPPPK